MKELDNFLAKVGTDKILHHVVGALICALITFVVILQDAVTDLSAVPYVIIGTVAVLFLSIVSVAPIVRKNKSEIAQLFTMIKEGGIKSLMSVKGGMLISKMSKK